MNTKLKAMLIDKISQYKIDKNILSHIKHLQFSYKHSENSFIAYITYKKVNKQEYAVQRTCPLDTEQLQNHELESINFNIEKDVFIKTVLDSFQCIKPQLESKPKHIVIDFSSPNIAKPFHVGHLRSTIIGNFIANINKFFNNNVIKINYLGDWGTQFGLLQYGLNIRNIDLNNLQNDAIRSLYEIYVEANKMSSKDENIQMEARRYFTNIEQGRANLDDWRKIRKITVKELANVYQRLGIQFDAYQWESDYNGNAIKDIVKLLEEKNILITNHEGKKIAKVNDRDVAVLKSDGSTLYLSRDIAALLDRYTQYTFDKMLYVVDNAQTDHFIALFDIVGQVNKQCAAGCEHIKFGRIKGMSTRLGNVVFLNDILDEAKQKMQEKQHMSKNTRSSAINDETCDILGTTAVIINDLKQRRTKDYVFNWDKALQSEGDSGIKLQYIHCRLKNLEKNCGVALPVNCVPEYLSEDVVCDVIAELAKFEHILHSALCEKEACIIVNYLFRLSRYVNRMFNELRVKNVNSNLAAQRLLVFHTARVVVKTGLEILGIKPLDEM